MSMADFEPMWLGKPPRQLYAALHPATGAPSTPASSTAASTTAVILVPPLLHELPRSRRLLAEVAGELAAMGLPCLRFDFFGTGDSDGNGEDLDFVSVQGDLDVATAALRERTGATRLVVLAWRGAALPVREWLARGGVADLVVWWEPIADGAAWLRELMQSDADERAQRPPPHPGVRRINDADDGQLMGFPASARLRMELAQARLDDDAPGRQSAHAWAVLRAGTARPAGNFARTLPLPPDAPSFSGSAAMDATLFLTPPVRGVVGQLGHALREGNGQ
jgi:hypothetical protein